MIPTPGAKKVFLLLPTDDHLNGKRRVVRKGEAVADAGKPLNARIRPLGAIATRIRP